MNRKRVVILVVAIILVACLAAVSYLNSVGRLVTIMNDDSKDLGDRLKAARRLGDKKDPATVPALAEALKNERLAVVAAESLAKIGSPAVEPLIEALGNPNVYVRLEAAQYFSSFVIEMPLELRKDKRVVEALIVSLKDPDSSIRYDAAKALGMIRDPQAAKALHELLRDPDSGVREQTIFALEYIHDPSSAEALMTFWNDPDPKIRQYAFRAALSCGGDETLKAATGYLADWNLGPHVSWRLMKENWQPETDSQKVHLWGANRNFAALKENLELARRVFLEDIRTSQPYKIENAVYCLISLGDEESLSLLVNALNMSGQKVMAEVFLNSGNSVLRKAAENWAQERGYNVNTYKTRDKPEVQWGTRR